jgi:hypothetical protein
VYIILQNEMRFANDSTFKLKMYKFQVSKRMEVNELKSLLLGHVNEVYKDDSSKLPSRLEEKNLGLYLFKPDFTFDEFMITLQKAYKSQFSHVQSIDIKAETLSSSTSKLFSYQITLNTSVIVCEIKSFFDFKLKGENEASEDSDDETFTFSSKPKPPPQLKYPEPSQYSMKGLTGLKNIGNTCFMNSALQCLSHTKDLKDYFLTKEYELDINPDNPMGSKDSGLVKSFASLIFELWNGIGSVVIPSVFKNEIGKFRSMVSLSNPSSKTSASMTVRSS